MSTIAVLVFLVAILIRCAVGDFLRLLRAASETK